MTVSFVCSRPLAVSPCHLANRNRGKSAAWHMKPSTIENDTGHVQPPEENEFDGWDFVEEGEEVSSLRYTPHSNP